ncbi:hypothetical protein CK203_039128 [Vitis vinifera]|uniref:Uncharacterized protein n=1 Tax=Vitis vinifera TaxID=29760 RepID=A0A438IFR6_VITVI|nr:hypothetical protein CK203_039128 [Vitis vinifera]
MEQIAWVRIYGLPISLWSPGTLKKIGEECGGFVDMDERTRSMGEIQWARILIRPVVKRPFSATENRRNKEVRGELHSRAEKRVGKELVGAGIEELQTPVDGSDLQENGPGPAPGLQFQGQENRDWASPIGRMAGPAASGPNMGLSGLKKDGGLNKMNGLLGRKLKNKPKVNDYSEAGPSWAAEMGCNQLTEVEGPEREGPIAPLEKAGFLGRFSSRKGPNSEDPLISWVIEEPRREQGDVGLSMTDRALEEEVKRYALNPYPKGKRAVGTPLLLFSNSDRAPEGESFDHPGAERSFTGQREPVDSCPMRMKIITWNVRGANDSSKRKIIKNYIRNQRVDLMCIQETKIQEMSEGIVRSLDWGDSQIGEPEMRKGCGWHFDMLDKRVLEILDWEEGQFSLSCRFKITENGLSGFLRVCMALLPKWKGRGGEFTWSGGLNNQAWARLDRFLVSPSWLDQFSGVTQAELGGKKLKSGAALAIDWQLK